MSDVLMRVHSKSNDRWFTVRLLLAGDKYGAERCLTWGKSKFSGEPGSSHEGQPGVEFYDAADADDSKFDLGLGNFTGGRYYAFDIRDGDGALDLMGYVPEWKIDDDAMLLVRHWLENVLSEFFCSDCRRPTRFDEDGVAPGYHHTVRPEDGCFLIPPELPDGTFEDGEWVAVPGSIREHA